MKAQLATLCGYAARRSPIAAMNCVRITETWGYACDAVSSMRTTWDGPKGVDVCVDAGLLQAQLTGIPDDQHIQVVPGQGFVHLHAGRRKLKLRTIPPDGMPEILVKGEPLKLPGADLEHALKFAVDACSSVNVAHPHFTNVVIDIGADGVWTVGSDSYRMHIWKLDVPNPGGELVCYVPRNLAKRVADLCKQGADVWLLKDRAICRMKDMEFVCMLVGAAWPNWRSVMKVQNSAKVHFKAGAKQLAGALIGAKQIGVKFATLQVANGEIKVTGDANGDEFEQTLDIDYGGDAAKLNVNPSYVADALPHMDEMADFSIGPSTPGGPLIIKSFEATAVIQGARI